jgi:organic radical activating enzyme
MTASPPIHNFVKKLNQPSVIDDVRRCVRRASSNPSNVGEFSTSKPVSQGPLSINLDLTVACNHACPHCIDESILNSGARFPFDEVIASLTTLRMVGLRSVIFIGGGEPTLYPEFDRVVQAAATLGLRIGIVSNGSRPSCLANAAKHLSSGDWIRFSLDAGSDEVFQRMHRPRTRTTLNAMCEGPRAIKKMNEQVSCGFSFVIISPEMLRFDARLTVNYHELELAARLAKQFDFDYISFKPFLVRDEEGKEVLPFGLRTGAIANKHTSDKLGSEYAQYISLNQLVAGQCEKQEALPAYSTGLCDDNEGLTMDSVSRIREGLDEATKQADERFEVIPSLNLLALFRPEVLADARNQPRRCHMQALRQVLTPNGIYGCPGYRGDERSMISARDGYVSISKYCETASRTVAQIDRFNASRECRNITCIYGETNWWLEHLSADWPTVAAISREDDGIPIFL